MKFSHLMTKLPREEELLFCPRPYFNHSVEFKQSVTARERAEMLEKVGLNVFSFPAEMITGCDLLSDSGTTTMTNDQWAALHQGDEAYGSNKGYFLLLQKVKEIFGQEFGGVSDLNLPTSFIFHQGRPVEDALFTILGRLGPGQSIPSNGHFDTTAANIEANNIKAVNLFSPELRKKSSSSKFKGNMDTARLEQFLKKNHKKTPLIYLTITNNTGGGQPVSLANIKTVYSISREFKIPLFFDACRFAENAWFIKRHEKGCENKTIKEIIKEMFSYVDGFTISFKKDGLVNMGGGLFLKKNGLFIEKYPWIADALTNHQIIKEGHPTYGGMSGRDIMTLVIGLSTVVREEYLTHRIRQVVEFGMRMDKIGVPVVTPVGGHAVYLDVDRFFEDTAMKTEDFAGISLTAVLLAAYGHRACELGNFTFGSYDPETRKEIRPEVNFVRFAVPRLRYEKQDLDAAAEAVGVLYQKKDMIPGIEVVYGRGLPLRHFKARFKFV
jgi:tryptophanase